MSYPGIRAERIEGPSGTGYALSFDDGVTVNCCVAVAAEDGAFKALRLSRPSGETANLAALVDAAEAEPRADVPWAFAMARAESVECLLEALGIPHVDRERAAGPLAETVADLAASTLGSLDADALAAVASASAKRTGTLAFYGGSSERAIRRRQAAASYPVLADVLASSLAAKMAIDRSRPLAETVASALQGLVDREVSKAVVKRVASVSRLPSGCDLGTVVRFMTLVPADWIPSGGPEWEAFCQTAHGILEDLGAEDSDVPALTKGCGGKWAEFCTRVARKSGIEDDHPLRAMRRTMFNAAEMVDSFMEVCVLPLAAYSGPSSEVAVTPEILHQAARAARAMLISGRSATDLSDLQRRWHQERATILYGTQIMLEERNAKLRGEIEEGGWPPLSATVQAPNGLWLVPLTNPQELKAEGFEGPDANGVPGLKHCVGGYSPRAKNCDCHIVSVRKIGEDGRYRRISTVEFGALQPGSNLLSVRQNQASGNGTPPAAAKDAVNWYVASVANGLIELNRAQIAAFLDSDIVPDDGVERLCGYDWRDRDLLNVAVAPWGPFVTAPFRGKSLDEIMDSPEIASVATLVPPEILLAPGR